MILQFPHKMTMSKLFKDPSESESLILSEFHNSWCPAQLNDIHHSNFHVISLQRWTIFGYGLKEIGYLTGCLFVTGVDESKYAAVKDAPTMFLNMEVGGTLYTPLGDRDKIEIIGHTDTWFDENRDFVRFFTNLQYRPGIGAINIHRAVDYIKSLDKPAAELTEMDARNAFANDILWRDAYQKLFSLFREIAVSRGDDPHDAMVSYMISSFFVDNGMAWMPNRIDEAIAEIRRETGL